MKALRNGEKSHIQDLLITELLEMGKIHKVFTGLNDDDVVLHVLVVIPDELLVSDRKRIRDRNWPTVTMVTKLLTKITVDDVDMPVTTYMTVNPPDLVAFWEALANDTTKIEPDAMITLPQDVFLFGSKMFGSSIYIRHCYPHLLEVAWKIIHTKRTPHLVILGNPGIGKIFFGYFILHHLAHLGNTVVYERGMSRRRYLFSRDVVLEGTQDDFIRILKKETTYYIVDEFKPIDVPAKTILLTYPRREIWYQFNKTSCTFCYMPVWSKEEIMKCHELLYQRIPKGVVEDRFRRWGGIARYVLPYAQTKCQQSFLESAIDGVFDLDTLKNACSKFDHDYSIMSYHLLHKRIRGDFHGDQFMFASEYVRDTIYKRLYKWNKQKLLEFIAEPDRGRGALSALQKYLLEAHTQLALP